MSESDESRGGGVITSSCAARQLSRHDTPPSRHLAKVRTSALECGAAAGCSFSTALLLMFAGRQHSRRPTPMPRSVGAGDVLCPDKESTEDAHFAGALRPEASAPVVDVRIASNELGLVIAEAGTSR